MGVFGLYWVALIGHGAKKVENHCLKQPTFFNVRKASTSTCLAVEYLIFFRHYFLTNSAKV